MKLGAVTKLDKTYTTTSHKTNDDVISTNYNVIVNFSIYSKFGAVRKLSPAHFAYDSKILIKSNILTRQRFYLWQKILTFCKKTTNITKTKMIQVLYGLFFEDTYVRAYIPIFKFLA